MNPVQRIEYPGLPLGKERNTAVIIGIPERKVTGPDQVGNEIIGGEKPEDRVLIAQRSPSKRLPPEKYLRQQKQQTQAENISLGLTMQNGEPKVQVTNLSVPADSVPADSEGIVTKQNPDYHKIRNLLSDNPCSDI